MAIDPRQAWCAVLAKLVAPMEPAAAARALAGMMPALAGYPDEDFTEATARWVASTGRIMGDGSTAPLTRVPTFGEIDAALGKWRSRWGPAPMRIENYKLPARREEPTGEEKTIVAGIVAGFMVELAAKSVVGDGSTGKREIKPAHLTPDQLALARRDAGIHLPPPIARQRGGGTWRDRSAEFA